MDAINVRTPTDFAGPDSPNRKRRHQTIACECCRKLKIRCQGGASKTSSPDATPRPCDHCMSLGKICEWPEEDGRKLKRQRQLSTTSAPAGSMNFRSTNGSRSDRGLGSEENGRLQSTPENGEFDNMANFHYQGTSNPAIPEAAFEDGSEPAEMPYTPVHYFRHLGVTALAPGHKKISLKARRESSNDIKSLSNARASGSEPLGHSHDGLLPLFDESSGLPVPQILPILIDRYFEYYSDIFCFTNRRYLDSLLEQSKPPIFLLSVMTTLSSRFCDPEIFKPYFAPMSRQRESWEYSTPFLEKSKSMVMSAMGLPTAEVTAGLLLMAFALFGDNDEAGLWMFTGMALRMAQELGFHRARTCLDKEVPSDALDADAPTKTTTKTHEPISSEAFKESSEIILFWAIFSMDTALCNGTGRVPSLKRHEINVRLPLDSDIAAVRAGPGAILRSVKPQVFPQLARMMLSFAQSIDFLNTGSSQIRFQSAEDDLQRLERLETLKRSLMYEYGILPKEASFGAIFYRAAVKSNQGGPYLLLHLQYHCQIAFLTQEILSDEQHQNQPQNGPQAAEKGRMIKTNQELYKRAIKAIADMLTFTKLIDERPLLSIVYLNQPLFHAACAYSRDMLESTSKDGKGPRQLASTAFPLPSDTSPSMVFPDGSAPPQTAQRGPPRKSSQKAVESTYNFLTLIAKANYQFLRSTIKDQAQVYAGSNWVDAVLDQRETGLRDVDLSTVSDSISTFIRLHDLYSPPGAEVALQRVVPANMEAPEISNSGLATAAVMNGFPNEFFADVNLDFDPQAFFDNYMYSELAQHQEFHVDNSLPLP